MLRSCLRNINDTKGAKGRVHIIETANRPPHRIPWRRLVSIFFPIHNFAIGLWYNG